MHLLTSKCQGASPPSPPEGGGGESGESPASGVGGGGVPPLPPSLLGSGAPLAAALGELVAGAGEEEADMGRLQVAFGFNKIFNLEERGKEPDVKASKYFKYKKMLQAMLEARGFPPHLAGVLGPRMHHLILNRLYLNTAPLYN